MTWHRIAFILCAFQLISADQLPTCQPTDFQYAFTDCDGFGGRWRVSVPAKPDTCTGGAPNAPTRAKGCYAVCDSGQFYNKTGLRCEKCPPGYYSLGGGVKHTSFNETTFQGLGFSRHTEVPKMSKIDGRRSNCTGWTIQEQYLESSATATQSGGCVSIVTYTVKIVKRGKLKFTYQYILPPDLTNGILFSFQHRNYEEFNEETFGYNSLNNIKFPEDTSEHQWKTMIIDIRQPGLYVFAWKSVTIANIRLRKTPMFDNGGDDAGVTSRDLGLVRIKDIELYGVAYASECTPCEAGMFTAEVGSSGCEPCPMDKIAPLPGSKECIPCDTSKYYALQGSDQCLEKKICTSNDYYEIEGDCDGQSNKLIKKTKWIEPKICLTDRITLPDTTYVQCNATSVLNIRSECSPGMEMVSGKCAFCRDSYYNDGSMGLCEKCPPSTLPNYVFAIKVWTAETIKQLTEWDIVSTQCLTGNYECDSINGWHTLPEARTYIRTSSNALLNSLLVLGVTIPGFRTTFGGILTFKFQIDCDRGDICLFFFVETKGQDTFLPTNDVIKKWTGDVKGVNTFKYTVYHNDTVTFSWVFQRNRHFQSHARIYEVSVSNSLLGGSTKCEPCPHGTDFACVPCPAGHYYEMDGGKMGNRTHVHHSQRTTKTGQCVLCPGNTVINASISFPIGRAESCIHCGDGLVSGPKRDTCFGNCTQIIDDDEFNLSDIKQPLSMKGGHLFTSGGIQYYHLFNLSLCGNTGVECVNNITFGGIKEQDKSSVKAMVCRSTVVPGGDSVYSTQSVSLGDNLIGITRSTKYRNLTVHPEFNGVKSDIHLYFTTDSPTVACKSGRTLAITLRCSPELEQEAVVSAPTSCPDGTCDGCHFNLLVRTKTGACRLCKDSDYDTVVGQCVDGMQYIHYINPKGCVIAIDDVKKIRQKKCSVIPRQVQLGIMLATGLGVILMALLFHFWKKNRRLEYKYSKLAENKMTAECCAEDDEDEEDDAEVKVRQSKRLNSGPSSSGYETIQLTKHSDHDDAI